MSVAAAFCVGLFVLVAFATHSEAVICRACGNPGEAQCPTDLTTVATSTTASTENCYVTFDVSSFTYRMGGIAASSCTSPATTTKCCPSAADNCNSALTITADNIQAARVACRSCGLTTTCSDTLTSVPITSYTCLSCSASYINGTKMMGCEASCIDSAEPPYKKCCIASTGTAAAPCNNALVTDATDINLACYDCGSTTSVIKTCPTAFTPGSVGITGKTCKACKAVRASGTNGAVTLSCVTGTPSTDQDCINKKCCYSSFCNRVYPTSNAMSYTPLRATYMWAIPTVIIGLGLHLVSMN